MPRNIHANIQSAVENKVIQCYESLFLDIDGGIRITNAPRDLTITDAGADRTFTSVGQFLGFSAIEEQRLFTTNEVTISLSGIPAFETGDSFIADILQYDYVDKDVRIYRSFFDKDEHIANGDFLIFSGRVDAPVIEDDPADTTTVATTCSSHWVDYERTNGMITNDNRQTALYTGDRAFQYANQVIKDITWKP